MVAELSLLGLDSTDLLSQITGQKIRQETLTPRFIFLAALATVLVGVTFADSHVTEEEKQHLQKTLNQFIPAGSGMNSLVKLMLQGVQKHQIYRKPSELLKLTSSLSESEKLLLLGFGYEMAMADGSIAPQEQKYLQAVAKCLSVATQHLTVLEAGMSGQDVDPVSLNEVCDLLDPVRFQSLDPIFANAADIIRSSLPTGDKHQHSQQHANISYKELERFQQDREQLDQLCLKLFQAIHDCTDRIALPQTIGEEVAQVSRKLQSRRFRLAVVGEFSQGKSTLLNALLGEELQPVRAIPCSGTVTVLKHGDQKRVTCRYRDGHEEEIPFDQYQEKASISEQAALCGLSDELARSNIEEIVLEHPGLELCRHSVEIIDSPGLNEHPDRTAVTQKLLQDTDAAIFLANASRPLTQGERDLLQSLRTQLAAEPGKPADNLFVLVNFMDLLRREKDRQQVRQLIENFLQGQAPIISGKNRLHYISAQAALDAILEGTEDEYLTAFQGFMQAIEQFLTQERGAIEIKQSATKLDYLIQESQNALRQSEKVLDGNVILSEAEKQKIMEQIGEASGRDTKIQLLADELVEQAIEQLAESWEKWADKLSDRIAEKSAAWSTKHEEKEKILRDYTNQFIRDVSADLDGWINTGVKDAILKPCIGELAKVIQQELSTIQRSLISLDSVVGSHLGDQYNLALANMGIDINFNPSVNADFGDGESRFFSSIGFGGGGIVAGTLLGFIGLGFLPAILAGGAIGALVGLFFGGDPEVVHNKMKQEVFEKGFKKIDASAEEILNKIVENVETAIYEKAELASNAISSSIEILDNLLEQQEKAHQETLQTRESEKQLIHQKYQQLSQIQDELQVILK